MPPLCLLWQTNSVPLSNSRPLSDHCGDHCASIWRPRQPLIHHGDGSASTLPPLHDLLCHYSSLWWFKKCTMVVLQQLHRKRTSGFGRPLSVLVNFLVAQQWHGGCSPVWRGLLGLIDYMVALVQIMAKCITGYRPLSEAMLYWHMYASLGLNEFIVHITLVATAETIILMP